MNKTLIKELFFGKRGALHRPQQTFLCDKLCISIIQMHMRLCKHINFERNNESYYMCSENVINYHIFLSPFHSPKEILTMHPRANTKIYYYA